MFWSHFSKKFQSLLPFTTWRLSWKYGIPRCNIVCEHLLENIPNVFYTQVPILHTCLLKVFLMSNLSYCVNYLVVLLCGGSSTSGFISIYFGDSREHESSSKNVMWWFPLNLFIFVSKLEFLILKVNVCYS
jgi:hypothetical protein